MLPLTWCTCYFPKIIILRFKVISEKIRKNPVNTEKTFSMYYNGGMGFTVKGTDDFKAFSGMECKLAFLWKTLDSVPNA